jgi:hypothetical protein
MMIDSLIVISAVPLMISVPSLSVLIHQSLSVTHMTRYDHAYSNQRNSKPSLPKISAEVPLISTSGAFERRTRKQNEATSVVITAQVSMTCTVARGTVPEVNDHTVVVDAAQDEVVPQR